MAYSHNARFIKLFFKVSLHASFTSQVHCKENKHTEGEHLAVQALCKLRGILSHTVCHYVLSLLSPSVLFHLCFWKAASLKVELFCTGPQLQSHSFCLFCVNGSGSLRHFCSAIWHDVNSFVAGEKLQDFFYFLLLGTPAVQATAPACSPCNTHQPALPWAASPRQFCGHGSVPPRGCLHSFLQHPREEISSKFRQCGAAVACLPASEPGPCPSQWGLDLSASRSPSQPSSGGCCYQLLFRYSLEVLLLLTDLIPPSLLQLIFFTLNCPCSKICVVSLSRLEQDLYIG